MERSDRARVYTLVLREDAEADVRACIDIDLLLDPWDDLLLPAPVREAWTRWYQDHTATSSCDADRTTAGAGMGEVQ